MYTDDYVENGVNGEDPVGLICRLYEKAAQRLEQAKAHLDEGKSAAAGEAVARAMEIVLELMSSLDTDEGGQIAADLAILYFHVQEELAEAATNQRPESIENAQRVMDSLHEGWKECRAQLLTSIVAAEGVDHRPRRHRSDRPERRRHL